MDNEEAKVKAAETQLEFYRKRCEALEVNLDGFAELFEEVEDEYEPNCRQKTPVETDVLARAYQLREQLSNERAAMFVASGV